MFIDRVKIRVEGGAGGRGCVAFRREKGVPLGGPNGGDGGDGGSVVLVADASQRTLVDFQFRPEYRAGRGVHGEGWGCDGEDAEDMIVRVPPGTVVRDLESGAVLADLAAAGQRVTAAKGGRGGRGNQHFPTSQAQAPRWAEPGEAGEKRTLELELRVLADVGLVGLPNAGKSLLLSRVSAARPKVADYPFTTTEPQLGVVSLARGESYVMADLPGLIEGAHRGVGLGHEFLRHVSRTRVLVHVVDVGTDQPVAALRRDYDTILAELEQYDPDLLTRPRIVAGNKTDLPGAEARLAALAKHAMKRGVTNVLPLSALTGRGVLPMLRAVQKALADAPVPDLKLAEEPAVLRPRAIPRVRVLRDQRGTFLMRGKELDKLVAGADPDEKGLLRRLRPALEKLGVDDALARAGARRGDRVQIGPLEFEYVP